MTRVWPMERVPCLMMLCSMAHAAAALQLVAALPAHVLAAVGRQVGAGDPSSLVGHEERHRVGNFVGRAEAAGGNLRDDLVAHLLGYRHHHVGADVRSEEHTSELQSR